MYVLYTLVSFVCPAFKLMSISYVHVSSDLGCEEEFESMIMKQIDLHNVFLFFLRNLRIFVTPLKSLRAPQPPSRRFVLRERTS